MKKYLVFLLSLFLISASSPALAAVHNIPLISRDDIIAYAETGVGSPYVWGGDTWDPNNRKWGGADCSGYVLKAWQIPRKAAYTESVGHPYDTYSFFYQQTHWYPIERDELQKGDMLVYRDKSGGHSVIYHYGDKWGNAVVYEARSKKTGIVHATRYIPSYFQARRRYNLVDAQNQLMATVKRENGTFIQAQADTDAAPKLLFDYFGQNDILKIRNADSGFATQVNASLTNFTLLESRSAIINPLLLNEQPSGWKQNAYMSLASGGQNIYAQRQTPEGYAYPAKTDKMLSAANFIDYFELKNDVLYITNPNPVEVIAAVYLMNDGKIYNRQVIKIAPTSVKTLHYKRSRLKKRLKVAFVRVNAKGGRLFVNKKTAAGFFLAARPLFKLSRLLYLPNFAPSRNLLYVANPGNKKVSLSVRYVAENKTQFIKRLSIKPRDVTVVDERKRLKQLGEVLLKIRAGGNLVVTRKSAYKTFEPAEPISAAAKTMYVASFTPAKEFLYIVNPVGFQQNAQVNVFADGNLVYSNPYILNANSWQVIDFAQTAAAPYTNTYVQIVGSL